MCVYVHTHTHTPHTHTHKHSGRTAVQQAEHARYRDMAEEMLKQARNDLADAHERHKRELQEAHARHTSELQEQAQPAEQLTQQVLQLEEEEVTLHQTASTPVVGDTSWRQLEMPSPSPPLLMPTSAHTPRRCILNIKSNSQAASSALPIVAGKQHERSLVHDEVVMREVKELGITRGSGMPVKLGLFFLYTRSLLTLVAYLSPA